MRPLFPLFQSHIDLAHSLWEKVLTKSDIVIDATLGNGHDTLFLSQRVPEGKVYAIDIQKQAIEESQVLLCQQLGLIPSNIFFYERSHEAFPEEILKESVKLIVYNLGYLPNSDKRVKTSACSTLKSVQNGLELLCKGGVMSLTCYSGHVEGKEEEEALMAFCASLSPEDYVYSHHFFMNRRLAPSLILIQKAS